MIGIGLGLGFGTGGRIGASWFTARAIARFGSDLISLYHGADILDTAGAVTSWPARVGNTLVNAGVASFSVGAINGIRALNQTASSDACLQVTNSDYARTAIAVATRPATVWPTYGTSVLLNTKISGASGTAMQVQNATTEFYEGSFWTHYVDGVASEAALAEGTHIYEGTTAVAYTDTTDTRTGDASGPYGWVGPRALLMTIKRQITAGERSATVADLQRMFKLV